MNAFFEKALRDKKYAETCPEKTKRTVEIMKQTEKQNK